MQGTETISVEEGAASAPPPLSDEILVLLEKGRTIFENNQAESSRAKEEAQRQAAAAITNAWSSLEKAARETIPEYLHPYFQINRSESEKPPQMYIVQVILPGFGPIEYVFFATDGTCLEWTTKTFEDGSPVVRFYSFEINSYRTQEGTEYEIRRCVKFYETIDLAEALGYAEAVGKKLEKLTAEVAEKKAAEEIRRSEANAKKTRESSEAAVEKTTVTDGELISSLISQARKRGILPQLLASTISIITKDHIDNALLEAIGAN